MYLVAAPPRCVLLFQRAMEPDLSPFIVPHFPAIEQRAVKRREQAGTPMLLCLQAQQRRFRLVSHSCTRLAE